jgi:RNA polymerase sigma factor (sigma-70 family)
MNTTHRESTFAGLMDRVRAGSQDAAWEIIDRFGTQIKQVVRRRLNGLLRSQFDSADFVQVVWLSFFRHPDLIRTFSSPQQLASFLEVMARNKVTDETRRRLYTDKYNLRGKRSYDDEVEKHSLVDRGPTPSAVAVAKERWESVIQGQPKHYQEVARLRFLGKSNAEIARELKIHERTVRKIIERLIQMQGG